MKEIVEKLSSYNLFNNLLPGVIFAYLATEFADASLVQDDLLVAAFLYYFIGVVISRIGSLVVEPILQLLKFVSYENYGRYLAATKKDAQISVLLENNNMYRTMISLFVSLGTLKIYFLVEHYIPGLLSMRPWFCILFLLLLFLFSYRKQTNYIVMRVRKK